MALPVFTAVSLLTWWSKPLAFKFRCTLKSRGNNKNGTFVHCLLSSESHSGDPDLIGLACSLSMET